MKWTKREIARLKRLVDERKTVVEIARLLGRTDASITSMKEKMGIYRPKPLSPDNPLHVAEVIKFKMAGWSLEAIAKVYRYGVSHVSNMLTMNGIKGFMPGKREFVKPYHYWSEFELHRLRGYCKREYKFDRICRLFPNRSRRAMIQRIQEMTRFWQSPAERKERKRLRDKWMEWRVY